MQIIISLRKQEMGCETKVKIKEEKGIDLEALP